MNKIQPYALGLWVAHKFGAHTHAGLREMSSFAFRISLVFTTSVWLYITKDFQGDLTLQSIGELIRRVIFQLFTHISMYSIYNRHKNYLNLYHYYYKLETYELGLLMVENN